MVPLLCSVVALAISLIAPPASAASTAAPATCTSAPTRLNLANVPYENYFYSDCHMDFQVILTSPGPADNLTFIGPRLVVRHGSIRNFTITDGVDCFTWRKQWDRSFLAAQQWQ
jgi:hypothetical protein